MQAYALLGLSHHHICIDILHNTDKGILMYFLGSAIWTMVHESELPGNFEQKRDHIWGLIMQAYDLLQTRQSERTSFVVICDVFADKKGPLPSEFPTFTDKVVNSIQ